MSKKILVLISVLLVATIALSACAPKAEPTEAPTMAWEAPAANANPIVCMVTDSGGIGDKSFNDLTWKGVQAGIDDFGAVGNYIESTQPTDFAPNLTACKDAGADLIVCVGFMMTDDCMKAVKENPDTLYAGVDMGGFDLPNFRGVTALMEQSSFLAGYLAAGTSETGKVGWYTGIMGPPVQIFGEGFYYGVEEYNKVHGTSVTVIGYDVDDPDSATVTGSWIDADKGRLLGQSLMQEGADIILPVCGGVGSATAAVMQETGSGYIFGVDQNWVETYPAYSDQILASLLKKVDVHIFDAIQRVVNGTWEGGDFVLTLANGGTGLAYNPAIEVPAELIAEIAALEAKIISGEYVIPAIKVIATDPYK